MNKNKKRLSKLLIPMLAVSGINVNAMENVKHTERSKSVRRIKTNLGNNYKIKSKIKVLEENDKIPNGGGSTIIAFGGAAWDEFSQKYELLGTYERIRTKLNIDGKQPYGIGAGAEGTVTECRNKTTGGIFAVKCEMKGKNNTIIGSDNSSQFYNDSKDTAYGWEKKKWAVKRYDEFSDDKVRYTVTDRITGPILKIYMETLKKENNLIKKVKKFGKVMKQLKQILTDLHEKGCVNSDISGKNIMVEINPEDEFDMQLKVVDNGAYTHNKQIWTDSFPLNCFKSTFTDAIESPHGSIFDYFDLKQAYTDLRNQGKTNDKIWYPPYNESENLNNVKGLLFLELSLIKDALGEPATTDGNGKPVFTPRVGDIQPDCMEYAIQILTNDLPTRLQNLKTKNYLPV